MPIVIACYLVSKGYLVWSLQQASLHYRKGIFQYALVHYRKGIFQYMLEWGEEILSLQPCLA